MHFAVQSGVRAVIEERPLAEAAEAYAAMDTGQGPLPDGADGLTGIRAAVSPRPRS